MEVQQKIKTLDLAISQIEKQFGQGSIMRMGEDSIVKIESISTGSISLDAALGIGGIPKGRITEIYGPESSGKTTLTLHIIAEAQKRVVMLHSLMLNMQWILNMLRNWELIPIIC